MDMYNMFGCKNISKSYKKDFALNDITFSLLQGECLGVVGDNGSGKSTLMSILAGMKTPEDGMVLYNYVEVTKKERKKISYVPQVPILIDYLTVKDNLKLWASVYNIKKLSDILVPSCLNISEMYNKKISDLSGGMQKKVSIAIALMSKPDFIIMDEAFAALDSKTIMQLMQYLKNETNMGIIYSSHSIHEIIEICDRIIVIKNGSVSYYSEEKENFDENSVEFIYSKF